MKCGFLQRINRFSAEGGQMPPSDYEKEKLMSVFYLELPLSEDVLKIRKQNNYEEFKVLYKVDKSKDFAVFHGVFTGEEGDDLNDYLAVDVSSTYKSVQTYAAGTIFVNVLKSTHDPKGKLPSGAIATSWKDFYKAWAQAPASMCMTDGGFYIGNDIPLQGKCCNNSVIVGGHVIIPSNIKVAKKPAPYETVGICPICNTHNSNNGNYMKLRCNTKVVLINYTLHRSVYQETI